MKTYRPPSHLSAEAKAMFGRMQADFSITDSAGLALLVAALEARDRAEGARKLLAKDGIVILDRLQRPKAHPAVAIERDARNALVSCLRALKLEPGSI